jgi:hypothetical protein
MEPEEYCGLCRTYTENLSAHRIGLLHRSSVEQEKKEKGERPDAKWCVTCNRSFHGDRDVHDAVRHANELRSHGTSNTNNREEAHMSQPVFYNKAQIISRAEDILEREENKLDPFKQNIIDAIADVVVGFIDDGRLGQSGLSGRIDEKLFDLNGSLNAPNPRQLKQLPSFIERLRLIADDKVELSDYELELLELA